jgi:Ca2+-binding RTX toxin-like protein
MSTVSITFTDANESFDGKPYEDDLILQMGGGNDYVHAGEGTNLVYLGKGDDYFESNHKEAGPFQNDTLSGSSTVHGGEGNDVFDFHGTTGRAHGGVGNDVYFITGTGHDVQIVELANEGYDTIKIELTGGATYHMAPDVEQLQVLSVVYEGVFSDDWEYTNNSYDLDEVRTGVKLVGNSVDNLITATDMRDTVQGGEGADTIKTGLSDDKAYGDAGNDVLWGEHGNDSLYGGTGTDSLWGSTGNDMLDGGADADTLDGGTGIDRLYGGAGDDRLIDGSGADSMWGGAGNDTYSVGEAGDRVIEGLDAGYDLVMTKLASYTLDSNVEGLTFTGTGNRTGIGNELGNAMRGSVGADTLEGHGGNDGLHGNDGNDWLRAGAGDDYASGGNGADVIWGDAGNDALFGNADADNMGGGDGNDQLDGGTGNDSLKGDAGADTLQGGAGNDDIQGGAGADSLRGGDGADVIRGGSGADRIFGDAGIDSFVYDKLSDSTMAARDRISGFEKGIEKIDLSAVDANAAIAGNQAFTFTGSGNLFKSAGDLWLEATLGGTNVQMDANGDGMVDMSIAVVGVWGLTANDFVL